MRTRPIHVTHGRPQVLEVRAELFAFSEVLDVVVTGRPDMLVVICSRHPRPGAWLVALRAAGYEIPARRRPTAAPPLRTASPHPTRVPVVTHAA
jgi:hypothetical protein